MSLHYLSRINTLSLLRSIKNLEIKRNKYKIYTKIKYGRWCRVPKFIPITSKFVEGVAYYIGDGRNKTSGGLSIVDKDISVITFFIKWLQEYFSVDKTNIKIKFRANYTEVFINRTMLKRLFDLIKPIIKEICLVDKNFASAYLRGIMAAEGTPKFNVRSCSRSVHLKMRDKNEIDYIVSLLNLLDIRSSLLYSKSDDEWLITISGVYELQKLQEINVFKLTNNKKHKFIHLMRSYKREQTKKGDVIPFYMTKINQINNLGNKITALSLAKFVKRDRTRTLNVLIKLKDDGLLNTKRLQKTGRPFVFSINEKGKRLLNNLSKGL